HHPARAHQFPSHQRTFRMKPGDRRLPQHANSARRRVIQQDSMQMGSPDSIRRSARKLSFGFSAGAHETNAAEWIRFAVENRDAEVAESLDSFRHQSFAAGLVDGRNRAVRHDHAQTVATRRDGRRQARWSATGYEDIPRIWGTASHNS